ncbi:SAM-dependent methyltransferase [Rhodoflexus caldus]|uniref:SAM-dependent methyltransferase n=1 Tax=Rhodoflexus caldus TaxID=2891236 RepID=UPI00202A912B|nr:SAM-dependent methyltransferase [Rhodoflexus caldus]
MAVIYLIPLPLTDTLTTDNLLIPQAREIIASTDYYLVENMRTARRFISSLKTGRIIEQLRFFELDKRTNLQQMAEYFKEIPPDAAVGVMSEAGCPGVADPGQVAVQYAHRTGKKVVPLVGPSSILLALMASGFNGQSFAFNGYLPIQKQDKIKALKHLEKEVGRGQTQIFIETPYRNDALVNDMLAHLQPHTQLCIAAHLTAPDEFIKTQTISDWQKNKPILGKVPAVFLLGSAS